MTQFTMIGLIAIVSAFTATTAQASIRCNGSYQVVNGREIATPYCQDGNLARLARQRGIDITDDEMRNDVGRKGAVCRLIGSETSARSACASLMDH